MSKNELKNYGGQALIEGVLMRGKKFVVAAFRKPDGKIQLETEELTGIYKSKFASIPFIRGLVILWDSLYLGMKFLTISANLQSDDDEKIEGKDLIISLVISITFAIGFFFIIPLLFRELMSRILQGNMFLLNITEGVFRLFLLVGYIWIIGFSKDIARVFAYHGAEHKTINAYENGSAEDVNSIQDFSVAHPRCGTSFMVTLVVISILFFSLFGEMDFVLKMLLRIMAIPLLSMISYEIIRWLGVYQDNPIVRMFTYPNLALQKLTTREPTDEMIEVAMSSFNKLLELEDTPLV